MFYCPKFIGQKMLLCLIMGVSRFAYDLSHSAYSHFAYSLFAYSENFDYSRFAYSSLLINIFVEDFYDYYSHSEIQCHYTRHKPK